MRLTLDPCKPGSASVSRGSADVDAPPVDACATSPPEAPPPDSRCMAEAGRPRQASAAVRPPASHTHTTWPSPLVPRAASSATHSAATGWLPPICASQARFQC